MQLDIYVLDLRMWGFEDVEFWGFENEAQIILLSSYATTY
jgi:hypothetical protein